MLSRWLGKFAEDYLITQAFRSLLRDHEPLYHVLAGVRQLALPLLLLRQSLRVAVHHLGLAHSIPISRTPGLSRLEGRRQVRLDPPAESQCIAFLPVDLRPQGECILARLDLLLQRDAAVVDLAFQ